MDRNLSVNRGKVNLGTMLKRIYFLRRCSQMFENHQIWKSGGGMLASLGWRLRSVWLCASYPPKHSPLEGHHSLVRPGSVLSLGFPTEIA